MASAEEHTLSSSALGGLIRLRMMLERALREAKGSSEPSRHIALVTLDGACEYAIRFSAHRRGLPLKPDAGFHAGIELLRNNPDRRKPWKQTGVRGVLELHAARNQTQHMGVLPDRELMLGWVGDARAFIGELIEVSFGVALEDVLLADAIRSDELRGLLNQAERELNSGDPSTAFRYVEEALHQARQWWLVQHDYARGYASVGLPIPGDADDRLEVQVFAADMTGYTQLLTTRRHVERGGPEPDEPEARSALLFAFNWILQWEAFNEGYPVERYVEYSRTRHSPQIDDGGSPRIAWHIESYRLEAGAEREEEFEMLLQLANIPISDDRDWGLDFPAALASAKQEFTDGVSINFQGIDPDGVLRVRVPVSAEPDDLVSALNRATELATESHQRRDQDMREWRLQAVELREKYATVLRETATGNVFGDIDVVPELQSTGVRYIVGIDIPSATQFELNLATSIFNGQGGHLAATSHQAGKIVFEAFPLKDNVLDRLRNAIQGGEEEILRYRNIATEHERERQSFTQQIENLLGSTPPDIGSPQAADEDDNE